LLKKIKQIGTMTQLQSTKKINSLKLKAIKKGGYLKFKVQILEACKLHLELFGNDLTPLHLM